MKLVLTRHRFTPRSTTGRLEADGVFVCDTLEDAWRPRTAVKIPARTAIPAGTYTVQITHSPRFGKSLPLLFNVPGFEGVRIHAGNGPNDTEGCILVGTANSFPDWVSDSRRAFASVQSLIARAMAADEKITIEIQGEP